MPVDFPVPEAQSAPSVSELFMMELLGAQVRPRVPLSQKIYLTLNEAVAYTGLTRAMLLRAIKSGQLKAIKDGGWKIRRTRLDQL